MLLFPYMIQRFNYCLLNDILCEHLNQSKHKNIHDVSFFEQVLIQSRLAKAGAVATNFLIMFKTSNNVLIPTFFTQVPPSFQTSHVVIKIS